MIRFERVIGKVGSMWYTTLEAFFADLNEDHEHAWEYAGASFQQPAEKYPDAQCDFSGYIEKCSTCGVIRQVPA